MARGGIIPVDNMAIFNLTRRACIGGASAGLVLAAPAIHAQTAFRLGLTPVFLDNDAVVIDSLRRALESALELPIRLEQRRTYEEVTGMLLQGSLDAAWLCGFPFLQHRQTLSLMAVPVWRGRPLYQSYLIVDQADSASSLADLSGTTHAFSDPDSNSGYLVTASNLARAGTRPDVFFSRTIFTFGHRNVVRAVADRLVQSGSVDGYVWEVLANSEPELAGRTKVIAKSEWLGFPPFCALSERMKEAQIAAMQTALLGLGTSVPGRAALDILQLDGLTSADPGLFDGIWKRMQDLDGLP